MSAEKMRDRKNKLGKLKKLNQILFQSEPSPNLPGQPMQQQGNVAPPYLAISQKVTDPNISSNLKAISTAP